MLFQITSQLLAQVKSTNSYSSITEDWTCIVDNDSRTSLGACGDIMAPGNKKVINQIDDTVKLGYTHCNL